MFFATACEQTSGESVWRPGNLVRDQQLAQHSEDVVEEPFFFLCSSSLLLFPATQARWRRLEGRRSGEWQRFPSLWSVCVVCRLAYVQCVLDGCSDGVGVRRTSQRAAMTS